MTTPDFVFGLRKKTGCAELRLSGTTVIVARALSPDNDETTVLPHGWSCMTYDCITVEALCTRCVDMGVWTPVTGIMDPRGEPTIAVVHETKKEAAASARVDRLVSVDAVGPITYENGDVSSYLDTTFVLEWNESESEPRDGENTEAVFLCTNALPKMNKCFQRLITEALSGSITTDFED